MRRFAVVVGLVLFTGGCSREAAPPPAPVAVAPKPTPQAVRPPVAARALVAAIGGSGVTGEVTFADSGNGLIIEAKISGLTPGSHGFHLHEVGDCSGDGSAAGPHFNPSGASHGGPDGTAAHAGDFGNLLADASGNAIISMQSRHITLDDGPNGIIGRSVIIHESADDLTSQPSGNSGARIACGLVERISAAAPATAAPAAEAPAAEAAATAAPAAEAPHAHEAGHDHEHGDGAHDH